MIVRGSANSGWTNSKGYNISGASKGVYQCNDALGLEEGFAFNDICQGTEFNGNSIHNYQIGLSLAANTIMGAQPHRGNKWDVGTNNNNHTDAYHDGDDTDILQLSFFTVVCPNDNSNTPLSWCPDQIEVNMPNGTNPSVTSNWFHKTTSSDNPTFQCSYWTCGLHLTEDDPDHLDALEQDIIADQLPTQLPPAMQWTLQQRLYQELQNGHYDLMGQEANINRFIEEQYRQDADWLYQLRQKLSNTNEQNLNRYKQYMQQLQASLEELNTLNSQISNSTNASQIAQWIAQKENIRSNMQQVLNPLGDIATQIHTQQIQNVNAARPLQARLSTASLHQQNMSTVQGIYLDALSENQGVLTEQQLQQIRPIAYQCPSTGGDAVYFARSLYSQYETPRFDDNDCVTNQSIQHRLEQQQEVSNTVKVYPNPTQQQFTIEYISDVNTSLYLYDMLGREVLQFPLEQGQHQQQVDVQNLPAGVYTWKINKTQSGKIIIQK